MHWTVVDVSDCTFERSATRNYIHVVRECLVWWLRGVVRAKVTLLSWYVDLVSITYLCVRWLPSYFLKVKLPALQRFIGYYVTEAVSHQPCLVRLSDDGYQTISAKPFLLLYWRVSACTYWLIQCYVFRMSSCSKRWQNRLWFLVRQQRWNRCNSTKCVNNF